MQRVQLLCHNLEARLLCPGRGSTILAHLLRKTALSTYHLSWSAGFRVCTGTPIILLNAVLKTLGTTHFWVNGWSVKLFHCLRTLPELEALPQAHVVLHDVALRYWGKLAALTSTLNEISS
jgi:hypothetical protein